MGHFSYTCRLSGLPITGGDKAVLIPLIPSNDSWYDNGEKQIRQFGRTSFVSNDGAQIFFKPLTLPVFGEYSGYGSLENIIEDDNTLVLEKHFGLTIQQIVDVICCGRKDDGYDDALDVVKTDSKKRGDDYGNPKYKKEFQLLIKASGTWMRQEVYEGLALQKKYKNYFDNLDIGVPSILNAVGFKETEKTNAERFNRVFVNGPITLLSDGNWIEVSLKNHVYNLKDLKKYCKKNGLEINISEIESKGKYEQIYDYILPTINDIGYRSRWEGDRIRSLFLADRYEPQEISVAYFDAVKSSTDKYFLRKNLIDWHNVFGFFFVTGHYLSPIGTSPQDGEHSAVMLVLEVAVDVLKNDIKKNECENIIENEEDNEY